MSRWDETTAAMRRFAKGRHWAPAIAVVLTLISFAEASIYSDAADRGVAMLVALGATVPLAFADRQPVAMATIITASVFAMLADTVPTTGAAVVAEVIALYLVASRTRRLVAALFAIPFVLNAMFPMGGEDTSDVGVLVMVLAVGALAIGDARRLHGEAIAERDVSRKQAAESLHEQAAMEERARIARELHDVVAHHVSKIAVQAETARLTTPGISEQEQARFGEIAETARDALGEMRRLLGVLRADAGGGGEREPQPGLAELQDLIDEARNAGSPVRFALSGRVVPLPPGVDLSAYRIVQEALTNARRHAPGSSVEVDLRYEPAMLHIRVRDDGPGPPNDEADGHGLQGMRERAGLVGGSVRTGPAADGGFLVEADLPIAAHPSEAAG